MKRYIIILFISLSCFFASCKTASVSTSATTETVTTVEYKPVTASTTADTLSDDISVSKITKAAKGSVIASAKKNNISYRLTKASDTTVDLEIVKGSEDVTVYAPATTTTITKETQTTVTESETLGERILDAVVRYIVITALILLAIVIFVLRLK